MVTALPCSDANSAKAEVSFPNPDVSDFAHLGVLERKWLLRVVFRSVTRFLAFAAFTLLISTK